MPTPTFTPADFPVLIDWPVQWGDQDMFGHVNNTVYFRWFESARIAYLDRLGLAEMHAAATTGPILAAIGCNFRAQVTFPDTVRIGTRVARLGNSSFTVEHGLWSTSQNLLLAADGTSTVVLFDYTTQRAIRIPDELRQKIEAMEGRKFG